MVEANGDATLAAASVFSQVGRLRTTKGRSYSVKLATRDFNTTSQQVHTWAMETRDCPMGGEAGVVQLNLRPE